MEPTQRENIRGKNMLLIIDSQIFLNKIPHQHINYSIYEEMN